MSSRPSSVIDEHIPSLTDEDEDKMWGAFNTSDFDIADLALRTCKCGKKIDGFYEYVDHLKDELVKAGFS